jgi:hypothetical protein
VSKLGYFIIDNVLNNDVIIRSLKHGILVSFKSFVYFAN